MYALFDVKIYAAMSGLMQTTRNNINPHDISAYLN